MSDRGPLRLVIGGGGALLIGSLCMSWAPGLSGWELLATLDVYLLILGVVALLAAITGGRVGVFRPDVSLNGVTDLLALVGIVLIASLAIFDFPEGTSPKAGLYVALIATLAIACAAGDYRPVRGGASWFPRLGA